MPVNVSFVEVSDRPARGRSAAPARRRGRTARPDGVATPLRAPATAPPATPAAAPSRTGSPAAAATTRALVTELTPDRLRAMRKTEARELGDELFARLAELDPADAEHGRVRGLLIELNLPLVRFVAARYRHRGEPMEDIVQAGAVGLVKAVDAYDPARGVVFASYAIPTISGEIKRFFRDTTWPVHVPRGTQELYLAVVRRSDELEQDLGRPPTNAEVAAGLSLSEAQVEEGRRASRACRTGTLDEEGDGPDQPRARLADRLGEEDRELDLVEFRTSVRPLIERLPRREREILTMRFWEDLTQSQIAERVGVSQMHVSRLLATTMSVLRDGLEGNPRRGAGRRT